MNNSHAYQEGFKVGREQAEGFHKGKITNRESRIMSLNPYMKMTEPEFASAWSRGRLDGYEDYMKDKEHIDVSI